MSDHEKLQAELSDVQTRYNELLAAHQETCKEVRCHLLFLFVSGRFCFICYGWMNLPCV